MFKKKVGFFSFSFYNFWDITRNLDFVNIKLAFSANMTIARYSITTCKDMLANGSVHCLPNNAFSLKLVATESKTVSMTTSLSDSDDLFFRK